MRCREGELAICRCGCANEMPIIKMEELLIIRRDGAALKRYDNKTLLMY